MNKFFIRISQYIFRLLAIIVGVFILIVLLFLFGDNFQSMPDNAKVIYNNSTKFYATPPCVIRQETTYHYISNPDEIRNTDAPLILMPDVDIITREEMRLRGGGKAKPDPKCRDGSGFMQKIRWVQRLFGYEARWTPDGEWRW